MPPREDPANRRCLQVLPHRAMDLGGVLQEPTRFQDDPELLLRILLIGYLYGITSERRLVEIFGCERTLSSFFLRSLGGNVVSAVTERKPDFPAKLAEPNYNCCAR